MSQENNKNTDQVRLSSLFLYSCPRWWHSRQASRMHTVGRESSLSYTQAVCVTSDFTLALSQSHVLVIFSSGSSVTALPSLMYLLPSLLLFDWCGISEISVGLSSIKSIFFLIGASSLWATYLHTVCIPFCIAITMSFLGLSHVQMMRLLNLSHNSPGLGIDFCWSPQVQTDVHPHSLSHQALIYIFSISILIQCMYSQHWLHLAALSRFSCPHIYLSLLPLLNCAYSLCVCALWMTGIPARVHLVRRVDALVAVVISSLSVVLFCLPDVL